jgi:hypothetical protein
MSGARTRALYNRLCALPGCRCLHVGVWLGSTVFACLAGNAAPCAELAAVDDWSEFAGAAARGAFLDGAGELLSPEERARLRVSGPFLRMPLLMCQVAGGVGLLTWNGPGLGGGRGACRCAGLTLSNWGTLSNRHPPPIPPLPSAHVPWTSAEGWGRPSHPACHGGAP